MNKKALPRPNISNPEVRAYVAAVRKGLKAQHVVQASNGWAVKRANASKASGVYGTQKEAFEHAAQIAKNNRTEVFVHGKDGLIRKRNSFGNDPHPPRG